MTINNIEWLTNRLPPVEKINLRGEVDYYGASHQVAKSIGLETPLKSAVSWRHGWVHTKPYAHPRQIAVYGGPEDTHLVHTHEQAEFLKERGYQKVHAVGMPFLYAEGSAPLRRPNTLLVMPNHSTAHTAASVDEQSYVDSITSIRGEFSEVVVCISKPCLRRGLWLKTFQAAGISVIEGAAVDDANALARMQRIFGSFEYVTSNSFGSHLVYAAAKGCKTSVWGPFHQQNPAISANEPFYQKYPEVLRANIKASNEQALRRNYGELFISPKEAITQTQWALAELGETNKRTPEALADLLGWKLYDRPTERLKRKLPFYLKRSYWKSKAPDAWRRLPKRKLWFSF